MGRVATVMVAVSLLIAGCGGLGAIPSGPVVVQCPASIDVLEDCKPCAEIGEVTFDEDPPIEDVLDSLKTIDVAYQDCRVRQQACILTVDDIQKAWDDCGSQ